MTAPVSDPTAPRALEALVRELTAHPGLRECIAHVRTQPPRPAATAPWPAALAPEVADAYRARGVAEPYTHQAAAIAHALAGRHTVVTTPTASGKTLCYNAPVLDRLVREPEARALYLFPTKALSHDQYREVYDASSACGRGIKVFTFDGDTPPDTRRALREAGHLVITNPDMLHCGILPHHTQWTRLFENLRFVVVDELHQYRGVFGSHLANVLARLRRLCAFYGSAPVFLASSATIVNPKELSEELTGLPFELVSESGAPTGAKTFVFYNPPVVNKELNVRRSVRLEARKLALRFIARGHQTIVFARSRLDVEVITTYLKRGMERMHRDPAAICGYRGGYLPKERRAIEEGVKSGRVRGVVSTNALELGIDIGGLDVSILAGWPGSVASAWQQAGRAGRKATDALAVYIGGSSPLDQYLMQHPDFFFGRSPEAAIINPGNLVILASHTKCAAFELPFEDGERLGPSDPAPVLRYLDDEKVVRHAAGRWYYAAESYPAEDVSLRAGAGENFIVLDTGNRNQVIAEVDHDSAPFLIHDDAVYIHNAKTYLVEKLDWHRRTAYVRAKTVDYYTDAESSSTVQVLDVDQETAPAPESAGVLAARRFGPVSVTTVIRKFKKVKFETQESIGYGPVDVPQLEIQTEACWFTLRREAEALLKARGFDVGPALAGVAQLLRQAVPLHVLCDARDISVAAMVRAPFDQLPTIYLWDRYPGGIGLARRLFASHRAVLAGAREMVEGCPCPRGCPSCVGAQLDGELTAKRAAAWLLERLA
ncbi:MAG: DEAD/DEAH box helicase [Candidatus Sumerlaeia bacterium]|nr:DEAD/DEAH box helicase [Candidatus Sumerlaeia bacterium]